MKVSARCRITNLKHPLHRKVQARSFLTRKQRTSKSSPVVLSFGNSIEASSTLSPTCRDVQFSQLVLEHIGPNSISIERDIALRIRAKGKL